MKVSYSADTREHHSLPVSEVDLLGLFEEPLLTRWATFGNGELNLRDNDRKVSMSVHRIGNDCFFLDWHYDGRMVPYNGAPCNQYHVIDMGGDPFRIPVACTVDKASAIRAVQVTAKHARRDSELQWVQMGSVPFPVGWYDG